MPQSVQRLLELARYKILDALPLQNEVARRRFLQIAFGVTKSKGIADCDPESVLTAIYGCARLGLIPDPLTGQVWILPYKQRGAKQPVATLVIGYKGYVELARRTGQIVDVRAGVLYENDDYEYEDGLVQKFSLRPWFLTGRDEPGRRLAAWCVWTYTDGHSQVALIGAREVERARSSSPAARNKSGPWVTHPDEMWAKTAVRRAARLWPITPELALALRFEDEEEAGETAVYDELRAEVLPPPETTPRAEELKNALSAAVAGANEQEGKGGEERRGNGKVGESKQAREGAESAGDRADTQKRELLKEVNARMLELSSAERDNVRKAAKIPLNAALSDLTTAQLNTLLDILVGN